MLDYKDFCQLSSLQQLNLEDYLRLQCLPKEGLPCSLCRIEIWGNCLLLKERWQKLKGEDWAKIAHVPHIYIDGVSQTWVYERQVVQSLEFLATALSCVWSIYLKNKKYGFSELWRSSNFLKWKRNISCCYCKNWGKNHHTWVRSKCCSILGNEQLHTCSVSQKSSSKIQLDDMYRW